MNTISLDTRLVRSQEIFASHIDDEVVMANLDNDKYYGLDAISSRIWQMLEKPKSLAEVCQLLMENYDVDESTCHSDVLAFAQELIDAQIVKVVSP